MARREFSTNGRQAVRTEGGRPPPAKGAAAPIMISALVAIVVHAEACFPTEDAESLGAAVAATGARG